MLLHHICHKEVHATLSEGGFARDYDTPQKLRNHPHLQKFIDWLLRKPPDFDARKRACASAESVKPDGLPLAECQIDSMPGRVQFSLAADGDE